MLLQLSSSVDHATAAATVFAMLLLLQLSLVVLGTSLTQQMTTVKKKRM
jgi:hypothetical protein